jgi:glycosyltransferase involved in cell wall biosynthesis
MRWSNEAASPFRKLGAASGLVPKALRIIYFTRGFNSHDRRFLSAFVRHGLEVGLVALHLHRDDLADMEWAGGRILGAFGLPPAPSTEQLDALAVAFRELVRGYAPDVVIAGPLADCAYIAAKAGLATPWVAQSWAFDVYWENEVDDAVGARTVLALRQAPALFADCAAVVRRCEQLGARGHMPHFVMPWGLEAVPELDPAARLRRRKELDLGDRAVFLHVRGLEPVYAVETLLQAFSLCLRRRPDVCLLLASDGTQRPLVERFIEQLGQPSAIRLLGFLPHKDLLRLYGAADVYVSCAASDGTSVSLLEAMAAGLPAIVNDRGGNPEWVTTGENGWVVPYGDVRELGRAMGDATGLPEALRLRMAEICRQRTARHADWARNFPRYLEFLAVRAARCAD